jgi:hypothetical protein
LIEPTASVNGRGYRPIAAATLAERTYAVYVGWSEHFTPTGVVRRDQNVSHLMVFHARKCEFACPLSRIPSNYRRRSQLWRVTHSPSQ